LYSGSKKKGISYTNRRFPRSGRNLRKTKAVAPIPKKGVRSPRYRVPAHRAAGSRSRSCYSRRNPSRIDTPRASRVASKTGGGNYHGGKLNVRKVLSRREKIIYSSKIFQDIKTEVDPSHYGKIAYLLSDQLNISSQLLLSRNQRSGLSWQIYSYRTRHGHKGPGRRNISDLKIGDEARNRKKTNSIWNGIVKSKLLKLKTVIKWIRQKTQSRSFRGKLSSQEPQEAILDGSLGGVESQNPQSQDFIHEFQMKGTMTTFYLRRDATREECGAGFIKLLHRTINITCLSDDR